MKKGFMFYFGFLLLILFGGVLVMMVVMLVNPGTSMLGFEYFSYSETYECEKTTDSSATELKLAETSYKKIIVNTDYASVTVQKGERYKKNSVVIINNSKGFVKSSEATDFSYSITTDGTNLNISVTEPKGMLFFSQDIQVIVNIASEDADPFVNTDFEITTKSGSVTFGGGVGDPYSFDFNVDDVKIQSESGNVSISQRVNYDAETETQTIGGLELNIGSGSYSCSANSLMVFNSVLQTTSGRVAINEIYAVDSINIKTDSGTYDINKITTGILSSDAKTSIECKNGYFNFKEVNGDLKFPSQDTSLDAPYLKADKITGDLTVLSGENLNFEIKEVVGNVNITTTGGSVKIGSEGSGGVSGEASIETKSGLISVYIKDGNSMAKRFVTESGDIEVYLLGQVLSNTFVKTDTGHTTINFETGKAYTFYFANANSTETFDMKRVKFIDFPNQTFENGCYKYNEGVTPRGEVEIYTNANIDLALLNIVEKEA